MDDLNFDDENIDFSQYDFLADDDDSEYDGGEGDYQDDFVINQFLQNVTGEVRESTKLKETVANSEVIKYFASSNPKEIRSTHLICRKVTNGWVLINYYTKIAGFLDDEPDVYYVNEQKYSRTTSKIQNYVRRELGSYVSVSESELDDIMYSGTGKSSDVNKAMRKNITHPFEDDPMFQAVESKKKR